MRTTARVLAQYRGLRLVASDNESARLVPARPTQWRTWADIADLFRGPADPDWERDRDLVDADVRDPWAAP